MKRIAIGVAIAALGILPAPGVAAAPHGIFHLPRHFIGRGTSGNWSGYDVTGSNGTSVTGSWQQPAVKCAAGENSWSSPWVGIDGDTSNTVEQIGTDSDCQNGVPVFYAWYEMYPKGTVQISMTVKPGDYFTGRVTATGGGNFTLQLTDTSTGQSFTTAQAIKRASLSSVEWIMEGPSNGTLSNFGQAQFSNASATINGTSGPLGNLSPIDPITMVTNAGAVRASPSSLSNGTSFSVTWQHG